MNARMDRLVNEARKDQFGHKVTACMLAIMENDTTTAYYRITNTFEALIAEPTNETTNEEGNEESDEI